MEQLNESVLTDNFVVVSLDVVNMFANIDHRSGLESAKNISIANPLNVV